MHSPKIETPSGQAGRIEELEKHRQFKDNTAHKLSNPGYFQTFGQPLIDNGYLVLPIKPGEKRPALSNWQTARLGVDHLTRYPGHGAGILCGQGEQPIAAIDIDTMSGDLAQRFTEWCRVNLGWTVERVGNAPKILLVYRAASAGWGKATGAWFEDLAGGQHRVEVLGNGQQFVAYHVHPDTGRPYEWIDFFGGLEATHVSALPIISQVQIEEALRVFEGMAEEAGLVRKSGGKTSTSNSPSDDPLMRANVTQDTVSELKSAIASFSENDASDYDFWIKIGHALKSVAHAGYAEEAGEMWHEFSAKSSMYDFEEAANKWAGFEPSRTGHAVIFAKAQERGWINPKAITADSRIDRTDTGNVALLAQVAEGRLRYVPERKCWLSWNGQRWSADNYGTAAQEQARQVAEHYHRTAVAISKQAKSDDLDDKERKRIEKAAAGIEAWATQCRNKSRIDNMLNLGKADARFILPMGELDSNHWLFGVGNGVVDLSTGSLRPAGREDYVTRRSPIDFDPLAKAPIWEKFIVEITGKPAGNSYKARPDLADYLQRALGYALTGSTAEHKMFIAVGPGANGKSVLLDLLQWILGDYCENISPETLMSSRHDADAERATPAVRKLAGARAAVSSESKDGQRLDVALVKRHTGGGYITARGLHENAFTFEITHKLWLMTNHKPALDHMDEALRGRIHMIPFDMRWNRPGHPERNPNIPDGDKNLPEKLKAEAAGILAWLVAGAVRYRREGLEPPAEVAGMTRAYFKDQDPLGLWLDECETCPPEVGTLAAELFGDFRQWCIDEGFGTDSAGSHVAFSKKLQGREITSRKKKDGMRYGLRVRERSELF